MSRTTAPTKKTAKPAAKTPHKAAAPKTLAVPFVTDDPVAAWKHYRAEANALDPASLAVCKADPDLVRVNATRGADAVRARAAQARASLPRANVTRALEVHALALALTHAIDRVGVTPVAEVAEDDDDQDSLTTRTSKMYAERALLVLQLKVMVGLGRYAAESLRTILEGSGAIDGARDVLSAIEALRDERCAGRHPFTDAWFGVASRRARRLLRELSPSEAAPGESRRDPASVERDAFWALLVAAHAELRTIGMVLFGESALDAKVPPLMARTAARRAPRGTADGGTGGDGPK